VNPGESAATMTLEPGFSLELVASEPLLSDPVALAFDGNGRIWVAEMVGYMPDVDGALENSTTGRISVLEDRDGDGRMDKHTVFLKDYHLPRAVALVDADKSLLFADNGTLYEAAILIDEAGGIRAGEVRVIDKSSAVGGNPEHKANGLMHSLDNWIYSAGGNQRYKKVRGSWIQEKTEDRGQWGISQDDFGRLLTNSNSNLISVEEIPPGLCSRNPHYTFRSPVTRTIKDQRLWPIRINPGVNRGYMKGTLDAQGYLISPTAVSGAVCYRGDHFPSQYYGNLFITEPAGNLVKRAVMTEGEDGLRTVRSALEGSEFLASTDERSRMVNAYTAPDGSLYLVDFYRGIIQHKEYMTSYLRAQVLERHLDEKIGLGRIWRVRHAEGKPLSTAPKMGQESSTALVAHLSHPNGWWRDTAQRLLVERGDLAVVPSLKALLQDGSNALAAVHAIWTLEGLGQLDPATLSTALSLPHARAVAEAIRAAESLAGTDSAAATFSLLTPLSRNANPHVRHQLAASLGCFGDPAIPVLATLVRDHDNDLLLGDLAVSGLSGRELALFQALPPTHHLRVPLLETLLKRNETKELATLSGLLSDAKEFRAFSRSSAILRRSEQVQSLLRQIAEEKTPSLLRDAIIEGLLSGGKDKTFKPMPVKALDSLERAAQNGLLKEEKRRQLAALFKVGTGEEEVFLLTEAHRKQFQLGEAQYQRICLGCHQIHGNGQIYIAPPLVGSEWVLESEQRLISILMDGLSGPIDVLGKTYTVPEIQPMMPGLRASPDFTDEQLAAIATYVRNAWGNGAPPVSVETITRYRKSAPTRAPWTQEELSKIP